MISIYLVSDQPGNLAKALATAARRMSLDMGFDIPVTVIMPSNANALKARACEVAGAKVVQSGASWDERQQVLNHLRRAHGFSLLSSADDLNVILGQGTVAAETQAQVSQEFGGRLDCLVVPCGSGGLLSGVALALREDSTLVFGAEPRCGADDCRRGLLLGHRIAEVKTQTIADGLRSPVGELAWSIIKQPGLVQGILTAGEEDIIVTMRMVLEFTGMVIEPSAAVPLAAVLFGEDFQNYAASQCKPVHVGIVLSGGNCLLQSHTPSM